MTTDAEPGTSGERKQRRTARSASIEERIALTRSEEPLSPEVLDILSTATNNALGDSRVRSALVHRHEALPGTAQKRIAADSDPAVRASLAAESDHLERGVLARLAGDDHAVVRQSVTQRDDLPVARLITLALDSDADVRLGLAKSPSTLSTSTLERLSTDPDERVRLALTGRPGELTKRVRRTLSRDRSESVRKAAAALPVATVPYQDGRGWTADGIRAFVADLVESGVYETYTPAERYVLFQQAELIGNSDRGDLALALAAGSVSLDGDLSPITVEDLEDFADGTASSLDTLIDQAEAGIEYGSDEASPSGDDLANDIDPSNTEQLNGELPVPSTPQVLDALEAQNAIHAISDAESVEFLIDSALLKMWADAYIADDPRELLSIVSRDQRDGAAERARSKFAEQLEAALTMALPEGYEFSGPDGNLIQPNLMQRHFATLLAEQGRVGNWSGTGAGKTLAAIIATRLVGAEFTLICCPNAVVENWKLNVEAAFPNARVETKSFNPTWDQASIGPRYLVLNYEMFQQVNSEADVHDLVAGDRIAAVVVDEVHYVKQRDLDRESRRRRLITGLLAEASSEAAGRDARLYVACLSATPVLNNLREGISMIEMVSGHSHDDLEDDTSVTNAMRIHQKLVMHGVRYKPPYPKFDEQRPEIDISHRHDEVLRAAKHGISEMEKVLLAEKLSLIVESLAPSGEGTLVYTEFVTGMVEPLIEAIVAAGRTVGLYTGDDKSGLQPFLDGDIDVLIGSSTIRTGVDGLQHRAARLIVASAPWTAADYEQLVGRLVRQGQQRPVTVVFPITFIDVSAGRWSYDQSQRLDRILFKRSLADAAVDGVVPAGSLRNKEKALHDAVTWLERLNTHGVEEVIRQPITVPLSSERFEVERRLGQYGDFNRMNAEWNRSDSAILHASLRKDPEAWANYHTLYSEARRSWAVVPWHRIRDAIVPLSKRLVIADLGCGEDELGVSLRGHGFSCHSFDHIAIGDEVNEIDIGGGIPLDDGSVDVVVCSLSLMGANHGDYLREAARLLPFRGALHIAESASRFPPELDELGIADRLERLGFSDVLVEDDGDPSFRFVTALRSEIEPDPTVDLFG